MTLAAIAGMVLVALAAAFAMPAMADDIAVQPAARDVSPPGVMPIPAGPLVRVPVPLPPPEPPRWWRYFLPETPDAATFRAAELTLHVSGVLPPAPAATCATADGGQWPCGASALFALRRFLHGRAIECYFPYLEGVAEITAPCRVGRQDIGLWLLQNGWARPGQLATDAYRAAFNAAACHSLGIWRDEARGANCPPLAGPKG